MLDVRCLTWNVRGLRATPKRNAVLAYLKTQRADIMVLVETHLTGQLQMALKKPWVGWLYQAPYSAISRGVAILVAKTVQFVLLTLRSDPQGRFLFLNAKVNGLEMLILAFYVPPPFQFSVINEGIAYVSQFPTIPAMWLGDFNNIMNKDLDRISVTPQDKPTQPHTRFGKIITDLALIDT